MTTKNILVFGVTGMVGRRVIALLRADGHRVTAAGRSRERLAALAVPYETVDLFDRDAVRRLMDGREAAINVTTHVPRSPLGMFLRGSWHEMDRIRREGSAIVADAAIACGVPRVVQECFGLVYPSRGAEWIDETTVPQPAEYNRSSLDAEASARRVTDAGGIGVALRLAPFYGAPEDHFTRDVLGYARRGLLPLFGPPDAYLPMITHDDAAAAVVAALRAPAGVYNAVDDAPLTRRELAATIGESLGVRTPHLPPQWLASVTGSLGETLARSQRTSNRKLRDATGWRPTYPSGREGWCAAIAALAT